MNASGAPVLADRGWKRAFDEPIPLPDGRELVTLEDAGTYITKLPKAEHDAPEWQAAMEALLLVCGTQRSDDAGPNWDDASAQAACGKTGADTAQAGKGVPDRALGHDRHHKKASTMITAALMAYMPSALMVTPQISMSNLSDMRSSPLKEAESLRGTIYLPAGLSIRQEVALDPNARTLAAVARQGMLGTAKMREETSR